MKRFRKRWAVIEAGDSVGIEMWPETLFGDEAASLPKDRSAGASV
jgi:hypothetical protein